jgi:hypothetical protein
MISIYDAAIRVDVRCLMFIRPGNGYVQSTHSLGVSDV